MEGEHAQLGTGAHQKGQSAAGCQAARTGPPAGSTRRIPQRLRSVVV